MVCVPSANWTFSRDRFSMPAVEPSWRDALGHKLKLVTLKVDERAQGVDVLGVGRIDIDGDLIAGIDLGLARNHRELAG